MTDQDQPWAGEAEDMPLPENASPDTVMRHFVQWLAADPASGQVRLFCHGAVPDRVMCILELPAYRRARSDGEGEFVSRATLSRAYRVTATFSCPGRAAGHRLKAHACDACRARLEAGALSAVYLAPARPVRPGNPAHGLTFHAPRAHSAQSTGLETGGWAQTAP